MGVDEQPVEVFPASDDDYEFAYQVKKVAEGDLVRTVFGWDEAVQRDFHEREWTERRPGIIRLEDTSVGTVDVREADGCVDIGRFFILPEYQNKGIGSSILRQVTERADQGGLVTSLAFLKGNRAEALYRRHGFRLVRRTPTHVYMKRRPENSPRRKGGRPYAQGPDVRPNRYGVAAELPCLDVYAMPLKAVGVPVESLNHPGTRSSALCGSVSRLLFAAAPFAEHAVELMLYGQFVGSWDVDATWHDWQGVTSTAEGEWHFAWILGGRGVQDVLFASGAPPDRHGTTLRCYDASADAWHIFWAQPSGGEFVRLLGRKIGDRIVQEVVPSDAERRERWSFMDVTPDTFTWLDEVSLDDGATWFLEQEMRATRRSEVDHRCEERPGAGA